MCSPPALRIRAGAYTNAADFGAIPLSHRADETAIREHIARAEAAWNRGDAAGFCAAMADDIDFINVVGEHHKGREDVERGHRHIFDTIYKGSRANFTIEGIRFVTPEVAIVFVNARLIAKVLVRDVAVSGTAAQIRNENQASDARPTMIFAKHGGHWKMVTFQNTHVASLPTARA